MKAVFLDRDGVINEKIENGYVLDWKDFRFIPGAVEGVKLLNDKKMPVIVISNQACVGKGLITRQKLDEINDRMMRELEKKGAHIDDIFICPHRDEDNCDCRKPKPGLFKQVKEKYRDIDLNNSWFIGDSGSDREAGNKAGCKTYMLRKEEDLRAALEKMIFNEKWA